MLQRLGGLLIERMRPLGGVACRWGGEEFVITFPCAAHDPVVCRAWVEGLREAVAAMELAVPEGEPLRLTVSIGLAHGLPGEPIEVAIQRADVAMDQAKQTGRNRVCEG